MLTKKFNSVRQAFAIHENDRFAKKENGEKLNILDVIINKIKTPNIIYRSYFIIWKYHLTGRKVKKNLEPSNGGRGIRLKNA